eukprot:gnl/Chilomastix_cuspidata/5885.p1 GENE.gnl/Chilomastix_cuspidata/5885~~gnl/Chilomastix_cuspidata/5885.p1  ORF type:complete len:589 (+),score=122.92 gnl/Chilomastix_cuspidata/5885:1703-3469(+)
MPLEAWGQPTRGAAVVDSAAGEAYLLMDEGPVEMEHTFEKLLAKVQIDHIQLDVWKLLYQLDWGGWERGNDYYFSWRFVLFSFLPYVLITVATYWLVMCCACEPNCCTCGNVCCGYRDKNCKCEKRCCGYVACVCHLKEGDQRFLYSCKEIKCLLCKYLRCIKATRCAWFDFLRLKKAPARGDERSPSRGALCEAQTPAGSSLSDCSASFREMSEAVAGTCSFSVPPGEAPRTRQGLNTRTPSRASAAPGSGGAPGPQAASSSGAGEGKKCPRKEANLRTLFCSTLFVVFVGHRLALFLAFALLLGVSFDATEAYSYTPIARMAYMLNNTSLPAESDTALPQALALSTGAGCARLLQSRDDPGTYWAAAKATLPGGTATLSLVGEVLGATSVAFEANVIMAQAGEFALLADGADAAARAKTSYLAFQYGVEYACGGGAYAADIVTSLQLDSAMFKVVRNSLYQWMQFDAQEPLEARTTCVEAGASQALAFCAAAAAPGLLVEPLVYERSGTMFLFEQISVMVMLMGKVLKKVARFIAFVANGGKLCDRCKRAWDRVKKFFKCECNKPTNQAPIMEEGAGVESSYVRYK